jgi:hypothetical protein
MNDKYDSSRIDMSVNDSIQKKRLSGQTYSVALDPKTGVSGYLGGTVSPEISASERAKESASQAVRNTVIVKDDHATLPASAP